METELINGVIKMKKFDYKKEYHDLYLPKRKPMLIDVPEISYVTVDGKGNPNNSIEYQEALELLYGISFTIKMSKKTEDKIPGYFEYVVPPLEGLWWYKNGTISMQNTNKDQFYWKSMIRLPEFVDEKVFNHAKKLLKDKKTAINIDKVKYEVIKEGKCVQIMHIGSYDEEQVSIDKIDAFLKANNLKTDFNDEPKHHEIYLSDPRRCKTENLKTVIRIPVK